MLARRPFVALLAVLVHFLPDMRNRFVCWNDQLRWRVDPPLPQATDEAIVSGAAIRAKSRPGPPYWGPANTILRTEPTWGDVDILERILTRLYPSNAGQLLAAFSSGASSAKAMQLIRNCAAHNNWQSRAGLQKIQSAYIVFPITHPTQRCSGLNPTQKTS